MSKSLKNTHTLNEKKIAFQAKDQTERKRVQSKFRKQIREAKKQYKDKIEFQFLTDNNYAWRMGGFKIPAGPSRPKLNSSNKLCDKQKERSDNWMTFIADLTLRKTSEPI